MTGTIPTLAPRADTAGIISRVNSLIQQANQGGPSNVSMAIKLPCRAATTGNITLSGLQTIDGVSLIGDERVLVWQQTDPTQNGIFTASSGTWSRAADLASDSAIVDGTIVVVTDGNLYGGVIFALAPV